LHEYKVRGADFCHYKQLDAHNNKDTEQKIVNENGRDTEMLKDFHLTFQQTKGASTDLLLRVEVEQPGHIWPRPGV
jgi:hypothetical protein